MEGDGQRQGKEAEGQEPATSVESEDASERQRSDRDAPQQPEGPPKHVRPEGEALEEHAEPARRTSRASVGRVLAPLLAVVVYVVMPVEAGAEARAVAAIGMLMAVSWLTEAMPLPATALLPIVLFPLTGVADVADTTAPYANDVIFLFMGGFMLALAVQRWGLHRRVALMTVLAVGTKPVRLIGGFMVATAFLSMWVSNTATTVMMLPIGVSVLALVLRQFEEQLARGEEPPIEIEPGTSDALEAGDAQLHEAVTSPFATCLMLAIAYAASIGSLATLIGTPPNAFMAGFVSETYDVSIGFGQWMMVGLPIAVVFLFIAWVLLTRVLFPPEIDEIPGGRQVIHEQLHRLGPMVLGERIVLGVFIVTAALWVLRGVITGWEPLLALYPPIEGLNDATIAMLAAAALFAIPVSLKRGVFLLDWHSAANLPWGILLLFGGGLTLAAQVQASGLDVWVGEQVGALGVLPVLGLVAGVVAITIFLTELTSNTATAATFLPILGGVAVGLGYDPLVLIIPATMAATCAFMMPVATPPNAVVFGSGHITIPQMVRAGIVLNVIGIVLVTLTAATLGEAILLD